MTDKKVSEHLMKWAKAAQNETEVETALSEISVMLKFHRQEYADKKVAEALVLQDREIFAGYVNKLMECSGNPKKEAFAEFLKILIEYRKANPPTTFTLTHD